jgi:hypothetical protein
LAAAPAHAAFIATMPGNDCAGAIGSCTYGGSQAIMKINFSEAGAITSREINNTVFPSFTGSEIAMNYLRHPTDPSGNLIGVMWSYLQGLGDPTITHFTVTGGPLFNAYSNTGDPLVDTGNTPNNTQIGRPYALEHITFFGTPVPTPVPVPEPARVC